VREVDELADAASTGDDQIGGAGDTAERLRVATAPASQARFLGGS
jgi:hypothetical protein